jgi:hypothetical protein
LHCPFCVCRGFNNWIQQSLKLSVENKQYPFWSKAWEALALRPTVLFVAQAMTMARVKLLFVALHADLVKNTSSTGSMSAWRTRSLLRGRDHQHDRRYCDKYRQKCYRTRVLHCRWWAKSVVNRHLSAKFLWQQRLRWRIRNEKLARLSDRECLEPQLTSRHLIFAVNKGHLKGHLINQAVLCWENANLIKLNRYIGVQNYF